MRLSATYRGGDDPFEGDRVVELRALPAGATVQRATLTVTPTNAAPAPPRAPFEEHFVFAPVRNGELAAADWGVTATSAGSSVEVDLHARRTLASVAGARIKDSVLAVDVGGLYVELDTNGAVLTPDGTTFKMTDAGALPGVTVPGFRLTAVGGVPAIDTVVVRSAPANVTIRLGSLGPFWTYVGDLAAPQTTPDFAETLRTFLLSADVRDGTYVIPFAVHADGVARMDLEIELEYVLGRSLLPAGLAEAVLPFDLSTFARSGSAELSVRLPAGAQVIPGLTRARVQGAFESTRIADSVEAAVMPPPAGTTVAVDRAGAQALAPQGADILASGFDLCLAPLGPSARLTLTLLADGDGKPFGPPLLRAPLELELTREQGRAAAWTTVPLTEPFHLEDDRRYWLVLQALDGEASWGAVAAAATAVPLQASGDGGFSWSVATDAQLPGPLTALHRLRVTPDRFTMPIAVDIGDQHVTLEEFEPLNRVDFTVDTPKLAQAFDAAVAAASARGCPPAEHLSNPGLDDWIGVGDELRLGEPFALRQLPGPLALSPDGRQAHVATRGQPDTDGDVTLLETVQLACGTPVDPIDVDGVDPVLVALDRTGSRAYLFGHAVETSVGTALAIVDLDARRLVGITGLEAVSGLAVAPDGGHLLLLKEIPGKLVIDAVDTRTIERVAIQGAGLADALAPFATITLDENERLDPSLPTAAWAATGAGGGTLFAFAAVEQVSGASVGSHVLLVTKERPEDIKRVQFGGKPLALAATADGRRIVVACDGDRSLHVIATDVPGEPQATSITLGAAPVAMTLSADGTRAAVLSNTDVAVYDLDSLQLVVRAPIASQGTTPSPRALAGSARLDLLLVADAGSQALLRLATDAVPVDWVLTSGTVEPHCFDGDLAALLGHRRARLLLDITPSIAAGGEPAPPRVPSSISQVVPVRGGCRYFFSFRALADQPASEGEVLWRTGDCGLARSDRVPITEFERPPGRDHHAADPKLVLHRVTLDAPPGTSQAEVRFTVPTGGLAGIGSVSLRGSDTVGADPDFQQHADGAPGWAADPGGASLSIERAAGANATRIVNDAAAAGSLVQSFAVTGGLPLVVEVSGRVAASGDDPGPALELRFFDERGGATGGRVTAALSRHAFDHVVLAADVPAAATRAELRLALPAGAAVELEHVRPQQPTDVDVPIAFRAEARGELAVSAAEVVYDVRPARTPALPATGVCTPTAPGSVPGAESAEDGCCCADHDRHKAKGATGKRSGERMPPRGAGLLPAHPVASRALTAVPSIGPARAGRLARAGIGTAERLAVAAPRAVSAALGGMSENAARNLIERARELVSRSDP
jgi:DNA-binding beta-propeller fold protein YncE